MNAYDIHEHLKELARWGSVYVPEFSFGNLRIDAVIVDISHRWVRGFEIKVNKQDFKQDNKWTLYTEFCSSLSIVCPEGLIQPEEVNKPFGLLWVGTSFQWKKRPKNFQKRSSLSWLWTYVKIIEEELPRLEFENRQLVSEIKRLNNQRVADKCSAE